MFSRRVRFCKAGLAVLISVIAWPAGLVAGDLAGRQPSPDQLGQAVSGPDDGDGLSSPAGGGGLPEDANAEPAARPGSWMDWAIDAVGDVTSQAGSAMNDMAPQRPPVL